MKGIKSFVPVIIGVAVLTGCAVENPRPDLGMGLAYHSDVNRNPDGNWQAAVEASLFRGRIGGARALVIQDATEKCLSEGKAMKVIKEETDSHLLINGVARLTFNCVSQN